MNEGMKIQIEAIVISGGVFLAKYNLVYMFHVAVRGTWPSTYLGLPRNPRHGEGNEGKNLKMN
jgi:hypothetical protein